MRKHAIIGSQKWPLERRQEIAQRINQLYGELGAFILVSGGADGVCDMAEKTGTEFGIPVISFRVGKRNLTRETATEFIVEEWRLYRGAGELIVHEPGWANFPSAALYKAMLIAERAETADAFWNGLSRGTQDEIECFKTEGVPCEVRR